MPNDEFHIAIIIMQNLLVTMERRKSGENFLMGNVPAKYKFERRFCKKAGRHLSC